MFVGSNPSLPGDEYYSEERKRKMKQNKIMAEQTKINSNSTLNSGGFD